VYTVHTSGRGISLFTQPVLFNVFSLPTTEKNLSALCACSRLGTASIVPKKATRRMQLTLRLTKSRLGIVG